MATSAFKSTTKRGSIGSVTTVEDSSLSNQSGSHRRSRSHSRFSHRIKQIEDYETPARKGRFVNTVRGGLGFPEISLDDLSIERFNSGNVGRSGKWSFEVDAPVKIDSALQRRGRSISRRVGDRKSSDRNSSGGRRVVLHNNLRRRRSSSIVPFHVSDSESDRDSSQKSSSHSNVKAFGKENGLMPSLQKATSASHRPILGRSLSQNDFSKLHDDYSSQSSALTDDEAKESHSSKSGIEMTIRKIYEEKKMQSQNSTNRQAIRRNYTKELDQLERRKQEIFVEVLMEEQRSYDLPQLLPNAKDVSVSENPTRIKKRSNDRCRVSKQLNEEAEKYFEDFISNVEDTDISSIDGERSDSSSTLRASITTKPTNKTFQSTVRRLSPVSIEMDGIVLPWLQWETSSDVSPFSSKKKIAASVPRKTFSWDGVQEQSSSSTSVKEITGNKMKSWRFDEEEYLKLKNNEDFLSERWKNQQRINSGGLLLCNVYF